MGIPITKKGYERLRAKLEQLKNEVLPQVQRDFEHARSLGDISESSEFNAAREKLWQTQAQIAELETNLINVEIVDTSNLPEDQVAFGAFVKVKDLDRGDEIVYQIVGELEANVMERKISTSSPIGQALMLKKVDEIVEFESPAGLRRLRILEIWYEK